MAEAILAAVAGAATSSLLSPKPPKPPPPPPTMSREEAMTQAQAMLNPLYDEMLNETLRNLHQQQIARGFFGQLPGAALERSTAADIRSRQAQQTAQLAEQMRGQEHARAMDIARQQFGAEQARWAAQQQNFQNILGGAQMGWNLGREMFGGLDVLQTLGLWGLGNRTDPTIQGSVQPLASSSFTLQPQTPGLANWIRPY